MQQSIGDEMAKIRQKQWITIDSPQKKVKMDEQDHEFKKQFEDFKHSGTHKQQIIVYSLLFRLLINYGYKYSKLPLGYINQLRQEVQLIESSTQQNNFQNIQEFIEIQQPTKEDYEKNVTHHENSKVIEELQRETNQFSDSIGKIMMQIFDNELFKSNNQNEDQTVSVCELLLDLADKNFYQLKIIEIVDLLIQDYQIYIDQKTYLAGNFQMKFSKYLYLLYHWKLRQSIQVFVLPEFDDIKKTPKFLLLQGLLMRIHLEVKPINYFDQAIEIRPNYLIAYIEKGVYQTNKQQFEEAIYQFENCLQINNMIAEVYFFKGIIILIIWDLSFLALKTRRV